MSGAGIAFTLLSLLFAWLLWHGRGADEARWRLRVRSLVPPLLLAALLPSGCASERFDALRLYATGMTVTESGMQGGRAQSVAVPGCDAYFRAGEQPVFVAGRQRGCVDLVTPEPSGAEANGAVVRLDSQSGNATLRLATISGGGGVIVAARDEGGTRIYSGAVEINDGDQLCLARCGGADAAWWTFRTSGRFERGDSTREMRLRPGPYGWVEPYGPSDRVHRVSQLLCARTSETGACEEPALNDARQSAVSFLFQQGGVGGSGWRIMLLDAGAQLKRADGTPVRPNLVEQVPLAEGSSARVAVLGLRGNALREIRTFGITHRLTSDGTPQRRFHLELDTPDLVPIGQCSQPLSRLAVGADQLSPEAFSLPSFGTRPDSVLASAAAGFPIERFDLCRSTRFAFAAPLDPAAGERLGGPILRQVNFSVDRMGIPWLLLLIAAGMALIVHAASESLWQRRPLDGILLALIQYLLVVRGMVGIEGVFNDASLDWRAIYGDIGTAMVALPVILLAARRRDETNVTALASIALFAAPALGALWWWLGRPDMISQFLALLAFGALALRAITLKPFSLAGVSGRSSPGRAEDSRGPSSPGTGGRSKADRVRGPAASATEENRSVEVEEKDLSAADAAGPPTLPSPAIGEGALSLGRVRTLLDRPPTFWPILLGAIVGARIILGLLGYRERFFGIALSAIYVPLLLICVAAILAQAEANPNRRRGFGLLFLGALGIGAGLVALVINDVGFALVHVPPIAGIAIWRLRKWQSDEQARPETVTRLIWAAPAAGLIAGFFALWMFVALTPPPSDNAPLDERVAYAVADKSTDPNWLRLRAVFAPDQIAAIGNRNAAIQLDQSAMLGELTGSLFGNGWLSPVDLGSFLNQATHLSDYLSASHLMAPFGRLGALSLILVLAAAAGAAVAGRTGPPAGWPNLAGALAAWTLFGAAAYMICANLLLVPFTGRNIYLLSASSGGDLMEGLGLLLMVRIGLAWRSNA